MKSIGLILLLSMAHELLQAQFFFTGEVRDPHGDKLQNGSIVVQSTGFSYRTGSYGEFGIVSRRSDDTLTLSFDGYEPYTTAINANEFLQITLKSPSVPQASGMKHIRAVYRETKAGAMPAGAGTTLAEASGNTSAIAGNTPPAASIAPAIVGNPLPGAVNTSPADPVENSFVDQAASVSFTGNIDRASYGIIGRFLDMGYAVPPEAVQIEEMLNYFNFYHEEPENEDVFHCSSTLLSCPWNAFHKLLCLDICARKVDIQDAPPANLVLLIDASGSMDLPNKLPMIKSGIRLLIDNLRDIDKVSLISFGGNVRLVLAGIPGSEKGRMIRAVQELAPNGSTPGEEGLRLAYDVARGQFIQGGNNRIVLITDGDLSEEPARKQKLEDLAEEQSRDGISLHCIGVGMSNDQESQLPMLAQKGQGNFAVAADERGAEMLLADQLARTSLTVADGVFITTDFNPALVKKYRLIGYDNKKNISEDPTFRLEGSQIGSGHSLRALFELIPKKDTTGADTIAGVKINYRLPGKNSDKMMSYYCTDQVIPFDRADGSLKRSVCIAMLGMKLRKSAYAAQISWADLEKMAKKNFTGNDCMDREYLTLLAKAKKIYAPGKQAE